jgi:hypothetical protein
MEMVFAARLEDFAYGSGMLFNDCRYLPSLRNGPHAKTQSHQDMVDHIQLMTLK